LPSDDSVPAAASPSWATLLVGNTLFWLAYSLASTATRVPSVSAPLAEWLQAWTLTTPQWVTGLLFTPLVFAMARRIPLDGTAWTRNAAVHALGAGGLTLGGLALQQGLYFALHPAYAARITWWASYTSVVADMALLCLMLYAGGVGIYHAWAASRRLNQAEAQRAALAQQLDATDGSHADGAPPTPAEASPDRILVTARYLGYTTRTMEHGAPVLDRLNVDLQYIHHKDDHFRRRMQTRSVFFFYDFDDVAGISATPVAARQDDYARIDAAAYDPAFWRDHPVLARTPTDRAAIASFERTGAFGRLTDMLE
jgi:hypothetical protein